MGLWTGIWGLGFGGWGRGLEIGDWGLGIVVRDLGFVVRGSWFKIVN
jgi:hypothetical protein